MNKEEILAKRITKFPESGDMTDDAIKRNVYVAMEEYASQQPSLRWIKAGEGYVPENPETKHWRFSYTLVPVLWRDAKKFAVSENHSDEVEWLSESSPTPKQEDEYKIALQWYKQGIEDAGESIGDGIDADFYDQYGEQFKQSLPKQSQDKKL